MSLDFYLRFSLKIVHAPILVVLTFEAVLYICLRIEYIDNF